MRMTSTDVDGEELVEQPLSVGGGSGSTYGSQSERSPSKLSLSGMSAQWVTVEQRWTGSPRLPA
jgi:hypothetical protein